MLVVDDVGVVGVVYVIHSFSLSINLSIDLFCIEYAVALANFFFLSLVLNTNIGWLCYFNSCIAIRKGKTPTCHKQRFKRFHSETETIPTNAVTVGVHPYSREKYGY